MGIGGQKGSFGGVYGFVELPGRWVGKWIFPTAHRKPNVITVAATIATKW